MNYKMCCLHALNWQRDPHAVFLVVTLSGRKCGSVVETRPHAADIRTVRVEMRSDGY